jgi:hypothetical protein
MVLGGRLVVMDQRDATLGEQTRTLLAEHGIAVTEDGVARAHSELVQAEERTTDADWQRLRDFIDSASL